MTTLAVRRMFPWLFFFVCFLLTTGIGAIIIGSSGGVRWGINENRLQAVGMDVSQINSDIYSGTAYWMLLAVCLGVPLIGVAANMCGVRLFRFRAAKLRTTIHDARILALARGLFFLGIAWILGRILLGLGDPIGTIRGAWGDSLEIHYEVRVRLMNLLSEQEMGFVYSGLLTLFTIPLYYALMVRKNWRAWLEVSIWFLLYSGLGLFLVQKLLISFALMVVGICIVTAGDVLRHWKSLLMVGVAFFSLIYFAMRNKVADWSLTASLEQVIFRVADGYPYAMSLGQRHPFTPTQYWVGSLVGRPGFLGDPADYNIRIFDMMFPKEKGATALSAPVWSYCDVGWGGVAVTLGLIAALCGLAGMIGKYVEQSVWAWALYILILVQLYHLTQIPFIGVLMWSYGAPYGILVLLFLTIAAGWLELRPTGSARVKANEDLHSMRDRRDSMAEMNASRIPLNHSTKQIQAE